MHQSIPSLISISSTFFKNSSCEKFMQWCLHKLSWNVSGDGSRNYFREIYRILQNFTRKVLGIHPGILQQRFNWQFSITHLEIASNVPSVVTLGIQGYTFEDFWRKLWKNFKSWRNSLRNSQKIFPDNFSRFFFQRTSSRCISEFLLEILSVIPPGIVLWPLFRCFPGIHPDILWVQKFYYGFLRKLLEKYLKDIL